MFDVVDNFYFAIFITQFTKTYKVLNTKIIKYNVNDLRFGSARK